MSWNGVVMYVLMGVIVVRGLRVDFFFLISYVKFG